MVRVVNALDIIIIIIIIICCKIYLLQCIGHYVTCYSRLLQSMVQPQNSTVITQVFSILDTSIKERVSHSYLEIGGVRSVGNGHQGWISINALYYLILAHRAIQNLVCFHEYILTIRLI